MIKYMAASKAPSNSQQSLYSTSIAPPGLYRERLMGRWIWFAADQESCKQQRQTRLDRVATQAGYYLIQISETPCPHWARGRFRISHGWLHFDF